MQKMRPRIGKIISPAVEQLTPLGLEFSCPDCIDKVATSKAISALHMVAFDPNGHGDAKRGIHESMPTPQKES
jgi:hypothetical protein